MYTVGTLDSWNPFVFLEKGFYEVDVGLSQEKEGPGYSIVDLWDVNGDKQADLISISDDGFSFTVHFYDKGDQAYTSQSFTVSPCKLTAIKGLPM